MIDFGTTGGFSGGGGCGGVRTPQLHSCTPQHVLHPPNIYLHPPPNIFAPYPRNYSIRGQTAYVPPNYSFLQLQTTPVLTFLMLSGTFYDSRRPIFAPPDPCRSSLGKRFELPRSLLLDGASRRRARIPPTVLAPPNNIALDPPLFGT